MPPSTTSKVTTDHQEIRHWAEARDAKPAAGDGVSDDGASIIRLNVPGHSSEGEEIGWHEWFNRFDEHNLALLYQEQTAGGEISNFNQIVSRETAKQAHSAVGGKGRSAAHKRAGKKKALGPRALSPRREEKGRGKTARTPASARNFSGSGTGETRANNSRHKAEPKTLVRIES